jgi:ligand-binding sensor domain-containing protein/signal transduction histidine kinase
MALMALPARALDPHTALAQYGYQSWQTDSGLPQNTVHAIVQGRSGFLWIATEGGLVRFDGADFTVFNRANTPQLPSDLIDGLLLDRSGNLWISTSGGLARMSAAEVPNAHSIQDFGPARGIPHTQIYGAWQDPAGTVWVMSAAGLFRIGDGQTVAQPVPLQQDLTENSLMAAGPQGSLWLGSAEGLLHAWPDGHFAPIGASGEVVALAVDGHGVAWAALRSGLEACSASGCRSIPVPSGDIVNALTADASGHMWIGASGGLFVAHGYRLQPLHADSGSVDFLYSDHEGMIWAGTARGIMRIAPGSTPSVQLLRRNDTYLAAAEDREGDLWFGTESGGLAVLRDRKFSTLTAEDGLTEEYVYALAQSANGDVWVGTRGGGLNVFHNGKFHAISSSQGLAGNVVLSVAAAPNGDVWAGTPDGLNLIRNGRVRVFTTADGLADDFVRSLFVDRDGALWIGTRHGLSRYRNGRFDTWSVIDGLGSNMVGAMAQGRDGALWIGTLGGLSRFRNGQFRTFTTHDGLSSNIVTALRMDRDGTLWIGTNNRGLNRMRGGHIVAIHSAELPHRILGILEDHSGYIWLSSSSGVYRVSRAGLNRMADGGRAAEVMRFGVADGMRISECSSGGHPAALRLRDGELWFATLKGIARVNPAHMPVNRVPPPVVIERISVDDVPEPSVSRLTIPPGHSHYEFDYAGLSFVAPQKVEYRYQLQGFDRGWVNAGTRRAAYYTNLPHGRYTFRVMARNNDGVWSSTAATAQLIIEPHFYQMLWFRLLAILALAGLGYAVWRRRLLGVEREFQAVLGERTRIAREIHDTLAQGFVAVSVQLELVAQLLHISKDAAQEQLQQTQAMVRSSLDDARTSIWELRSQTAEREDLATRVLKMAEEVASRAGSQARVQMQVSGTYRPLDPDVEREAARIAREAVVNSVRHGHPQNILLRLEYDGSMFGMEVRDDGRGFDGPPADGSSGHFGVTGMRERAAAIGATLTIESQAGQGTWVRLALPLGRDAEKKAQPQI